MSLVDIQAFPRDAGLLLWPSDTNLLATFAGQILLQRRNTWVDVSDPGD